jgi:uncharacterized protein
MISGIFVNLPVKDLDKTKSFWKDLGFGFNSQFTDENAACLVIGDNMYAMLLLEKFFKSFIKKEVADTSKVCEVITALSVESRAKVDKLVDHALKIGGKFYNDPSDHGWMYSKSFQDVDGHLWEVVYMEMNKLPQEMKNR